MRQRTLGDLMNAEVSATSQGLSGAVDIAVRWRIPPGDLVAKTVQERLQQVWACWSRPDRKALLLTAEALADAEKAKRDWNPKTNERQYLAVATSGTDALRLAHRISTLIPPPWEGEAAAVSELVAQLVNYAKGAVRVTAMPPKEVAIVAATSQLKRLREDSRRRYGSAVPWDLVRDLTWLAEGAKEHQRPSESTIRRYAHERNCASPTPARPHWSRNWKRFRILRPIATADRRPNRFRELLEKSLQSETCPETSM